jgi:WhiB family transcriptional regulator, redox-sensing transcriptional regulator
MRKTIDGEEILDLLPLVGHLLPGAELGEWTSQARCTQTDQELWFPPKGDPGAPARAICMQCEVRIECLAYGTRADEHGIWGGLNRIERRSLLNAFLASALSIGASGESAA